MAAVATCQAFAACQLTAPDEGATFVIVPSALRTFVAEGGLSRDAGWLYFVLLSHHNRGRKDDDVWPSRAVLAREMGMTKPDSVDKYLAELRDAGLIVSEQRRRSGNMKTSSKHTLRLVAPRTPAEVADRIKRSAADTPAPGYRYPRQRNPDTPVRGYELEEVELEELKDVEAMSRTSGRFAPGSARHGNSIDQKTVEDWNDPWDTAEARAHANNGPRSHERATYENWHDRDRQTFVAHVGEVLISDGSKWKEGRYTSTAFYNAFRLKKENRKRWPGQYLETLSGTGDDGVNDWLIDQGLIRPEWQ